MTADHQSADNARNEITPALDPAKADSLQQFIEQVGGIENAKRALKALADIERRAA